jgi:hypothetical protein
MAESYVDQALLSSLAYFAKFSVYRKLEPGMPMPGG